MKMKFADFAWVATTTCLVGQVVFGQPTTDENGCISPVLSLRNVARQTTLDGVAQLLKEVRDTVVKPSVETPPQLNTNPVFLLTNNCIPLLIQQHINGWDVFNRSWAEFKMGFNDSNGNFWLGNELLHQLTNDRRYKLRFELRRRSTSNTWYWAEYSIFVVTSEASKYLMRADGYSGNVVDSFGRHDGAMFTTFDSDNDDDATQNCAVTTGGGFWWNYRCWYCGVNTPLSSRLNFRWSSSTSSHSTYNYFLMTSRMWLTC